MRFPRRDGTGTAAGHEAASDPTQRYMISIFAALAWCNSIELIVLCFTTFKRYRGWYFWSLLFASCSLIPHCLGYIFYIFPLGISTYISVTLIILSWCVMVTGHSLVLWSRLSLVLQAHRVLSAILIMIIIDAIIFHIPTTVLMYGSLSSQVFASGYNVMERIQLVGFCIQECIISGTYIWETAKTMRLRPDSHHHKILAHLLAANVVILVLDVAVVGFEYAGYYALQVMFKPLAYSIKFKLEYAILGRLIQIAKGSCSNNSPLSCTAQNQLSGSHPSRQRGSGSYDVGDIDRDVRVYMSPVVCGEVYERSSAAA
ncbi:hypothetical protein EYZ11_006107 [Aspergillus tanneri]|uniref:DUF7703 domain-containing protein n=1 Tax=Aspergillus tanneri TaxID=1220188 RepID=A0A4S3JGP5_9EURO|nr:uncharacterized protein ATNIH1004_003936 [Aspergillus tanneri]KAA8648053.1 hypothetical protein ATNIH1004_003936 [Aspergillus tanneri]THC94410.1 hypothetical protein EYZ11_006107 [Aspergillus tanneri]